MMAVSVLGFLLIVLGGIGTLIAAFRTSVWWGLGCLLIAPVSLLFLIVHWNVAKNPFLVQLAGGVLLLAVAAMGGRPH